MKIKRNLYLCFIHRELHAIFRSLQCLDGWLLRCQSNITSLQEIYSGVFLTSVSHGKMGIFNQSWWNQIPLLVHIPIYLTLTMYPWACNWKGRAWTSLHRCMDCPFLQWSTYNLLRSGTIFQILVFNFKYFFYMTGSIIHLQSQSFKPEAEHILDPQHSNGWGFASFSPLQYALQPFHARDMMKVHV